MRERILTADPEPEDNGESEPSTKLTPAEVEHMKLVARIALEHGSSQIQFNNGVITEIDPMDLS